MLELLLEYGKYALVAGAILFGLIHVGGDIRAGLKEMDIMVAQKGANVITHSFFVGKGDGPLLSIGENGINSNGATVQDAP